MLFTVHAFKSKFSPRAPLALHCTARLPIQPSSSTVTFFAHEKGNNESLRGAPAPTAAHVKNIFCSCRFSTGL